MGLTRRHLGRLLPVLAYDHPNYFKVAVGLVAAHFGLALDIFFGAASTHPAAGGWHYQYADVGGHLWIWGVIHMTVAVLGTAGMYADNLRVMRAAWLISFIEFNSLAIGFFTAAVVPGHNFSFYAAVVSVSASLTSLAALGERPVNPAMRKPRVL